MAGAMCYSPIKTCVLIKYNNIHMYETYLCVSSTKRERVGGHDIIYTL